MATENSIIVRTEIFQKAVRNDARSSVEAPVYDTKFYINFVRANGDNWARPLYPNEYDKKVNPNARFAAEYEAYTKSQSFVTHGFPITELAGITVSEIAVLKEIGIITVEGLSNSSRSAVEHLDTDGRFLQLRDYSISFLKQKQDMEKVFEVQKKNEALEIEIMRLKGEIAKADSRVPAPKVEKEDAPGSRTATDADVFSTGSSKKKPIIEVNAR